MSERRIKFPLKTVLDVSYTTLNGKKWFWSQEKVSLQCSYCLYVQMVTVIRESGIETDKSSIVVGFKIAAQGEQHHPDCPQV